MNMKNITGTRFFKLIKGKSAIITTLDKEYDNFAALLFAGSNSSTDKTTYHNTLVYTRVELAGLAKLSEKKCGNLSGKGYRTG
jgi:hypothetical protein